MGWLPCRVYWTGDLDFDEHHRLAVTGDDVPRPGVAMTDHRLRPGQAPAEPGPPERTGRRHERSSRGVQVPQQPPDAGDGILCPGVRLRAGARDVADHPTAVFGDPGADHPRR